MSIVTTAREGDILIVTSNNPPVNALGAAVRQGLAGALEEAAGDPAIRAIVIRCEGRTFFAGADITEFGKPPVEPILTTLCPMIEASAVPVIAAIHGTALGGGLELALSCNYRIAVPSAKLGLPEVKLGILPGAGGTQRLPRVIGVEPALEMIVSGTPIGAKQAASLGLVDRLAGEDSLLADAIAFANEVKDKVEHPVASRREDKIVEARANPGLFDAYRQANARKLKGFEAPEACIQAVQAAVDLPFAEGIQRERELFTKLVTGVQSAAQRHLFFAERKAAKIDDVPADTPLIPVRKIGIIGAGTMGGGIAMNFLSVGLPVTIVEVKQDALDRGIGVIRRNYEASAARGRLQPEQVEAAMGLLTPSLDMADLADCDLVIEAVFENMAIKKDIFAKLDGIVKQGAILATNTSFLNVDEIAAATKRPGYVLGLHFFSPANVMRMLEVVRGAETRGDVLLTAMALAKAIGKVSVVAGVCFGFIGNRMLFPRQTQAEELLAEGATPDQIDRLHVDFGMPMGPLQMADLAGVDVLWHRDPTRIESITDAMCAAGRLGQKVGKGFYDYDDRRRATPSPEAQAIIEGFSTAKGIARRAISDQEIIERTLYPMINEGAAILAEGKAQRASDIDVMWVYGYGWPVYRGGPMFWADHEGLDEIVAGLERQAMKLGPDFRISPLLRERAASGGKFGD